MNKPHGKVIELILYRSVPCDQEGCKASAEWVVKIMYEDEYVRSIGRYCDGHVPKVVDSILHNE